ncbi:hypothetical protein [Paraburkholderia caribensis]|uniref:hypothetical protein n=1 Tax=Paraburkholderia caribensis TaxID=75105 RepID=UPI001CC5360C|nr:hypothetical protein [Paraburkholderia caribensis]
MANAAKSLRLMVEHWLAPDLKDQIRVTRFRNRHSARERYVSVEAFNETRRVEMFFFRHPDGNWRIFPPSRERLTMVAAQIPPSL